MLIRKLAQIVFRQVCVQRGRSLEEPDPPPVPNPIIGQTQSVSAASSSAEMSTKGTQASDAGRGPQEQTLALVILFTQLAQRRVQVAQAQEETHEYGAYHHSSPRTDSLRLRATINPMASA